MKEQIQDELNLSNSIVYFDEPMKKHTTFKIGGNAECLIKVNTIEDLQKIIKFSKEKNIPLTIMGNGSNILVLDGGIDGITLIINIKKFEITENNNAVEITVGAGNNNIELSQMLLKKEITGFEEISGIPGTIGGAVRMNAGAYGKEIQDIVKDVTYIDMEGNIRKEEKAKLGFKYRDSVFSNKKYIVLEATLELKKGNKEEIKEKMNNYNVARKEKQPLNFPNAGSTFKRGEGYITAQLIDECGLKGFKIGGAEISTKHAGFVINTGNATAKDVIEITNYVKKKVYEKFQKKIELEIEIVGKEK